MNKTDKEESIILILSDLDSLSMKNIMASCSKHQIDQIILCGSTPTPSENDNYECPWSYSASIRDSMWASRVQGYDVVAVKSNSQSLLLSDSRFPAKAAIVIGNMSDDVADYANRTVHLSFHQQNEAPNTNMVAGALLHHIFCEKEQTARNRIEQSLNIMVL